MKIKNLLVKLLSFIVLTSILYSISIHYINIDENEKLYQKYITVSNHMKNNFINLILDKQNATLALALSIAKNNDIKESLIKKQPLITDLQELSKQLKEETKFKNVWFQVINQKGISIYRSWTNNTNDSLVFRPDVKIILENKKVQNTISVGKYDFTFKSMVPIFSNKEMIGIFEVITHFNSISQMLENNSIDSIIVANKEYSKKLIYPLSNKFLGEYYIANIDAKKEFIDIFDKINIEKFLQTKEYVILDNKLITIQEIELNKLIMGYAIMAKNLSEIDINNIEVSKKRSISYLIFFIIFLAILFLIINYYFYLIDMKKLNKNLEKNLNRIKNQEKKNQTILDSQKNIIVITDGKKLQNANQQLLKFFNEYETLDNFKKMHDCICEKFIEIKDESYVTNRDYEGRNWAEHILDNPNKEFNAAILKDNKIHHFTLNVTLTHFDAEENPFIIVTLTDITKLIENNKLANEKDRLLFQQNKMASMGEMLNNIAHQWRQPLSVISGITTSIILKRKLNILDFNEIDSSCEKIMKNTEYLSKTIEDFRNFFKQDKSKENFNILESINENLNLIKERLKVNNIEVTIKIDRDVEIYGFKNEFQQAILNILNNSIDAFKSFDSTTKKLIIIEYQGKSLSIKDSAGGINDEIIEKIFEPYFTTKHQTQGTGIGLYMTQEILTKHMNANLRVENSKFEINNEVYSGANFIIEFNDKLPLS